MILTPIHPGDLPARLAEFGRALAGQPMAAQAFARIAATLALVDGNDFSLSQDPAHHARAVALCRDFQIPVIDEAPQAAFSWDGRAIRTRSEPSVLIHEVAHYLVCPPERRTIPDFGLGAGPESGEREAADRAALVFGVDRDVEEAMASLLGILWEAELGQLAICAFLEQNWLEGGARPENLAHFGKIVGMLREMGLVEETGRPAAPSKLIPTSA